MTRRILALFGPIILALVVGCQAGARFVGLTKSAVHIGSTKVGIMLLPAEYRALHPELESLFNQPVMFDPSFNGAQIGKQLVNGNLQFAFLSAREYAEIPASANIELLCAGLNADGKTFRKGLLIASAKSDVKTLSDCKGRRFAFGPEHDPLLDRAAVAALRKAGVELADLKKELPPFSLNGRLNVGAGTPEICKAVAFDGGVPCGAVDELGYKALPETGGSLLTGASRDQLRVLGETETVPEMVVVAGPRTDATKAAMLKNFLVSRAKSRPEICKQLGVTGFGEADAAMFGELRERMQNK